MKKGLIGIFGLVTLMLISGIIAYQSTITVNTGIPSQEIIFKAADPDTGKTLEGGEFREKSDSTGKVVFDYNLEPIRIKAGFMAWNGNGYLTFLNGKETVFIKSLILDKFVDIDLNRVDPSIKAYNNETNKTVENEVLADNTNKSETGANTTDELEIVFENNTETDEKQGASITGEVVGKGKSIIFSIKTYYILGGFFVLIFGFIFIKNKAKKSQTPTQFKVTKLSEMKDNTPDLQGEEERLTNAEKKLNEAKTELEEIKQRKNKLREAQERLEKDKEELRRLKSEEEGKDDDYLGLGRM